MSRHRPAGAADRNTNASANTSGSFPLLFLYCSKVTPAASNSPMRLSQALHPRRLPGKGKNPASNIGYNGEIISRFKDSRSHVGQSAPRLKVLKSEI